MGREPENRNEEPESAENRARHHLLGGTQKRIQTIDEGLEEAVVPMLGSQPHHQLAEHGGSGEAGEIRAQRLPFPVELEGRQCVQIPVLTHVQRCLAFGERLDETAEAAAGTERAARDRRARSVLPGHQAQDLARVAVAVGLKNHAARGDDRHGSLPRRSSGCPRHPTTRAPRSPDRSSRIRPAWSR